jgi:hypothetical protein
MSLLGEPVTARPSESDTQVLFPEARAGGPIFDFEIASNGRMAYVVTFPGGPRGPTVTSFNLASRTIVKSFSLPLDTASNLVISP